MWDFNIVLVGITSSRTREHHRIVGLDVAEKRSPEEKDETLRTSPLATALQKEQLGNADSAISFAVSSSFPLLNKFCQSYEGLCTSDDPQFLREFWELPSITSDWKWLQSGAAATGIIGGSSTVLLWEEGTGRYFRHAMSLKAQGRLGGWKSGGSAWEKMGLAINVTGQQLVNFYRGAFFDNTIAAVMPNEDLLLLPILTFVASDDYSKALRQRDQSLSITELKFPDSYRPSAA